MTGLGMALLAPPATAGSRFNLSTTAIIIVAVIVVVGIVFILGWRAPDRSPKIEKKVEREEAE